MATHPDYPGASSKLDRKGKTVWRYRSPGRNGKQVALPGEPGEDDFHEAYLKATQRRSTAEILNMPGRAVAFTFGKAARLLESSMEWQDYDHKTRTNNARHLEKFMNMQVSPDYNLKWRDTPVAHMTAAQLRDIITSIHITRPTTAYHWLVAIRKLVRIAIEQSWIEPENDPTLSIKVKKSVAVGAKAWSEAAMAKYEARHPLGTPARTGYEIAKWIGNRRADVATLSWDQKVELEIENEFGDIEYMEAFDFHQTKNRKRTGGKHMVLPITDKFAAALAAIKRTSGLTVLQRYDGEPYSINSLTNQMAVWTEQAGLSAGHTFHGLRKNFAQYLVRTKVNLLAIRDMMGHSTLAVTQVYVEGIKQEANALEARNLVNEREAKRDAAKRRSALKIVA